MRNTKSLLAFFLACMMVVSCMVVTPVVAATSDGSAAEAYGGGAGTADDPYIINTAEELKLLADTVNAGTLYSDTYFRLGADIVLNDTSNFASWATTPPANKWTPIADTTTVAKAFMGHIDGQGHTIEGMYIYQATRSAFIGYPDATSSIENITFKNAYVVGKDNGTAVVAGQLVGSSPEYALNNITVTDSVVQNTTGGGTAAILGRSGGFTAITLNNCDVINTTVTTTGHHAGGIMGRHESTNFGTLTFKDCDVTGCTITAPYAAGGLFAGVHASDYSPKTTTSANEIIIDGCTVNSDAVNGKTSGYAGGAIGQLQWGAEYLLKLTITNSSIKLNGLYGNGTTGGLVGRMASAKSITVSNVVVDAPITSTGGSTGGMIGQINGKVTDITFNNSAVLKNVSGTSYVAGFIGNFDAVGYDVDFVSCAVTGDVTGTGARIGGFVGDVSHNSSAQVLSFKDCYVKSGVSGTDRVGGYVGSVTNEYTSVWLVDCLAYGSITATTGKDAGAMIGMVGTHDNYYADSKNTLILDNFYYDMAFSGVSPRLGSFIGFQTAMVYESADCETDAFKTLVFYTPQDDASSTERGNSQTTNNIAKTGDSAPELVAAVKARLGSVSADLFGDTTSVWGGESDVATAFESGFGTADDPYVIATAGQLAYLASLINANNADYVSDYYVLGANIQLNSDADVANAANWSTDVVPSYGWTPIGYEGTSIGSFKGTFDGAGYTISGMYIDSSDASVAGGRVGLFGKVTSATIKNLTIKDSYVNGKTCTAILVGFTNGIPTLTNISVNDCTVVGGNDGTSFLVGKSGGFSTVNFTNCYVSGEMTSSYGGGGFIGYISGTSSMGTFNITNCSSDIKMNAIYTGAYGSGGIFGIVGNYSLKDTDEDGKGDTYSYTPTLTAINIVNTDGAERVFAVDATAKRTFGGLIGQTFLTSLGDITIDGLNVNVNIDTSASTVNNSDVGGLIGYLTTSKSTGTVTVKNTDIVGSISAGQNSGIIIGRINNRPDYETSSLVDNLNAITVQNVTENVFFDIAKGSSGVQAFGGVVGLNQKTITTLIVTNLETNNTFTNTDSNGKSGIASTIGGVMGSAGTIATATLTNCEFNDTIDSGSTLGGLFGSAVFSDTLTVDSVTVNSDVIGSTGAAAGLVARSNAGTNAIYVADTVVTGTISAKGSDGANAGGMLAQTYALDMDFINSGVTGAVKMTTNGRNLGGFIGDITTSASTYGWVDVDFEGCYFTGTITAGTGYHVAAFIGDYDPDGGTLTSTETDANASFTFKNCYANTDITAGYNVAGLIGRVYVRNATITVEDTVLLGDRTATTTPAQSGALVGLFHAASTVDGIFTIDNLYYNGADKLAAFNLADGVDAFAQCVFYTHGTDNTTGVTKQANITLVNFIEAMKAIKNSDGTTPAWYGMAHTCESVEMNQETTADDVVYDSTGETNNLTMTLGCQVPGCASHAVTGNIGVCFGASIRTESPIGIRFGFRMDELLKVGDGETINMGVVLLPTDLIPEGEELTLETDLVQNTAAAKTFTSGKYYVGGAVTFTGVLVNIPTSYYDREITARAYVQIGDTVYYTQAVATTYNEVAVQVAATN